MSYTFDLVVGADGVHSFVRRTLFPEVTPRPPTGNCAYRAVVPYDEIRKDPITRELVEDAGGNLKRTMEVWMAPTGYSASINIDTLQCSVHLLTPTPLQSFRTQSPTRTSSTWF